MTFRGASLVDLHAHLLPGVDEGVRDPADTREALRALGRAGVLVVAATPRVRASTLALPGAGPTRLGELDRGWEALREVATSEEGLPAVLRGAEVVLDASPPDLSEARLRLAGADAVLVALPRGRTGPDREADPAGATAAAGTDAARAVDLPGAERLRAVAEADRIPVLASAELHLAGGSVDAAEAWRDAGAVLQVGAGSLLGRHGEEAERAAWALLERGWAGVLAGGCGPPGPVVLDEAAAAVHRRGGAKQVGLLVDVNPRRLVRGEAPRDVPPLPGRGLLGRLADLFR